MLLVVLFAASAAGADHQPPDDNQWQGTPAATLPARVGRISVRGRWFVDELGRVRLFHGFNDVGEAKGTGPFTGRNYLPLILTSNQSRVTQLVDEYGFNCFRIMASWAAVQPTPDLVPDTAYTAALRNATKMLGASGAFTLLDMHQDSLSSRFGTCTAWPNGCSDYDGAPLWLVNRTVARHPYPWPWAANSSGISGQITEAEGQAWEDLYRNARGGLTAWAAAWKSFASVFKAEKGIVGYELFNEPWAGDVYKDPLLFLPGVAGRRSLQPAYDRLAEAIREVDTETTILFEPMTWGMIKAPNGTPVSKLLDSGFEHVPGGSQWANRSAYSFHYYCWAAQSHKNDSSQEPYDPVTRQECDGTNGLGQSVFHAVDATMSHIGGASFMTEFGGIFFDP